MTNKCFVIAVTSLFLIFSQANADTLRLLPENFIEEVLTGPITINDKSLATDDGRSIELRLLKKRPQPHSRTQYFYEIVGEDNILLCNDRTPANYIQVTAIYYEEFDVFAHQKRTNTNGKDYIAVCGEYAYLHSYINTDSE